MSGDEPTTAEAIGEWIERHTRQADIFGHVANASNQHRLQHGCDVYPTADGPLLGVLAASTGAERVLELGCGLGYSALWLAHGGGSGTTVETIERDGDHAELARRNFAAEGYGRQITVVHGESATILPTMSGPFDLIFYDGDIGGCLLDLENFSSLIRPGGTLVSANLFLGQYDPAMPGLEQAAEYRERLLKDPWMTVFLPNGKALSVRR
jgi:predicted O-methyltransferase YrrM